jgi:transposase-like protein
MGIDKKSRALTHPTKTQPSDSRRVPETLSEAVLYYTDLDLATRALSAARWQNAIECPHCHSREEHFFIATRRIWTCRSCRKQFSLKVGTILEDSPIAVDKWLVTVWIVANSNKPIPAYRLHRVVGVSKTTARFMLRRIQLAMQAPQFTLLESMPLQPIEPEELSGEQYPRFTRLLVAIAAVPKSAVYEPDPRPHPKS